jgi:hypothetical protein
LKPAAEALADWIGDILSELEILLGWPVDFKPVIVLIDNSAQFEQLSGTADFSAFAVSDKHLMVIDYTRLRDRSQDMRIVVKHELCHLLLHRYIRASHLPRWLDEGVSQWVSDGFSELILGPQTDDILRTALLSGSLLSFQDIDDHFPANRRLLVLAYAQSRSLVKYLVREYGEKSLINILQDLKNGVSPEKALEKNLTLSLTDMEANWQGYIRRTGTWMIWLTVHVEELLFFGAALATIFGFIRLWLRKKRYNAKEEEEDDDDEEEEEKD